MPNQHTKSIQAFSIHLVRVIGMIPRIALQLITKLKSRPAVLLTKKNEFIKRSEFGIFIFRTKGLGDLTESLNQLTERGGEVHEKTTKYKTIR